MEGEQIRIFFLVNIMFCALRTDRSLQKLSHFLQVESTEVITGSQCDDFMEGDTYTYVRGGGGGMCKNKLVYAD